MSTKQDGEQTIYLEINIYLNFLLIQDQLLLYNITKI